MTLRMKHAGIGVLALVVVLLLTVGAVTAHGNGGDGDHDAPVDGTAAEWGAWMEQHMAEHMGVDAAKRMQERMGMSYTEMGEHMTDGGNGTMMGGMGGMGCH